jgi:ketosteroid isomerase-like protein
MSDRHETESRIRELHSARVRGDLAGMCRVFADDGVFKIAGSSNGQRVEIAATGMREFKPWLAMMVKTFRLSDYNLLSQVIDGRQAAAHWRVDIHSKITGQIVPTELIDLIEVSAGRIVRYTEFFVPR